MQGPETALLPAEAWLSIMAVTGKDIRKRIGTSAIWSGLTIHCVRCEKADSARVIVLWRMELFSLTPGVLRMTGSTGGAGEL